MDVVLDLPVPLSVNKMRRIDWAHRKDAQRWRNIANGYLMLAKTRKENPVRFNRIKRFELTIVLDEGAALLDADNATKLLIDYLVSVNIIENDAPKNMRKLTVEWGSVETGCRVFVKAVE